MILRFYLTPPMFATEPRAQSYKYHKPEQFFKFDVKAEHRHTGIINLGKLLLNHAEFLAISKVFSYVAPVISDGAFGPYRPPEPEKEKRITNIAFELKQTALNPGLHVKLHYNGAWQSAGYLTGLKSHYTAFKDAILREAQRDGLFVRFEGVPRQAKVRKETDTIKAKPERPVAPLPEIQSEDAKWEQFFQNLKNEGPYDSDAYYDD